MLWPVCPRLMKGFPDTEYPPVQIISTAMTEIPYGDTAPFVTDEVSQSNNGSLITSVPDSSTSTGLQANRKLKRTQKDKEASKQRRINRRANMPPTVFRPRTKEWPDPPTIPTLLNCSDGLPVESTGFSGRTSVSGSLKPGEHWTVDELTDMGFGEIPWDGK